MLSIKQQAFADHYIELGNATDAYIKAGYKVKSNDVAKANASRLLANANVSEYIAQRMKEISSDRVADQAEVMEFLTSVMRGKVKEPMSIFVGDGVQDVVEVIPNAQARKAAAELIGKRYAMWTDKQQIDGNLEINVNLDDDDE